jgi:hypothetical protein
MAALTASSSQTMWSFCHYFYYVQRPEDRVLRALVRKTKTIREELGSLARIIDDGLDVLMKNGIRRAQSENLAKEIDAFDLDAEQRTAVEEELEASRERKLDLKKQVDQLRNMLESSQEAISFSKPHFASAVSCALQILGAEPLKTLSPGEAGSMFVFPALDHWGHALAASWMLLFATILLLLHDAAIAILMAIADAGMTHSKRK